MRIIDILRIKGGSVVTVPPDMPVEGLVSELARHRIGAAVVSRDGVVVEGIVSERDVVRALAERGPAVLSEPLSAIQTTQVRTVSPEAQLEDVARLMTERRFRHVPVVVNGRLSGVVSIGDVVKNRIDELETERSTLADYITGDRT
ncbi:CBS domain-containing protein [Actinoplanes regularis]|uniref:CBS domain-containing protein n=1 Tax=Actinoplanes regularis TaxID=52697 RepID=A0A239GFA0_9ACTN|nr:CBS domain-containing protein [Actinoplanes regularis]GIE90587.1 signal transduction protein [Actinoplanes regularis]GLW34094.1 signal transduction protein [Actinoplanes regularis]SNS67820.1 CBS domain-containing protein [Actinoplanes regularis]